MDSAVEFGAVPEGEPARRGVRLESVTARFGGLSFDYSALRLALAAEWNVPVCDHGVHDGARILAVAFAVKMPPFMHEDRAGSWAATGRHRGIEFDLALRVDAPGRKVDELGLSLAALVSG